jgi:hypothetical protein
MQSKASKVQQPIARAPDAAICSGCQEESNTPSPIGLHILAYFSFYERVGPRAHTRPPNLNAPPNVHGPPASDSTPGSWLIGPPPARRLGAQRPLRAACPAPRLHARAVRRPERRAGRAAAPGWRTQAPEPAAPVRQHARPACGQTGNGVSARARAGLARFLSQPFHCGSRAARAGQFFCIATRMRRRRIRVMRGAAFKFCSGGIPGPGPRAAGSWGGAAGERGLRASGTAGRGERWRLPSASRAQWVRPPATAGIPRAASRGSGAADTEERSGCQPRAALGAREDSQAARGPPAGADTEPRPAAGAVGKGVGRGWEGWGVREGGGRWMVI